MKTTIRAAFFAASLTGILQAQSVPKATLLALSKTDHTLAIVDPETLKVIAKAPVGDDPHEVVASSDGKTAYVSNYGFGAFHSLAVIDLVAQKALPSVELGALRGPHGLVFVEGKAWFTAEAAKSIGRYDPATGKVDLILGIGQNRTHMIYVAPDLKRIIVTNVNSGTVSILEEQPIRMPGPPSSAGGPAGMPPPPLSGGPGPRMPRTDWNETVVKVGNGSEGFDVSPDGREAWVANAQDGTVSVIDVAEKKVTDTIDADARSENRLKITVDGKYALVSVPMAGSLVVIDTATHKVVKRIAVGRGAGGILVEPDGKRVYVACSETNSIAVLDTATWGIVGHIESGGNPDGMAWAVRR